MSRLLPFLFFTVIFMVLPAFFSGDFVQLTIAQCPRIYRRTDCDALWNAHVLHSIVVYSYDFFR